MSTEQTIIPSVRQDVGWPMRLLWFVLVGWWATFTWINVAWFLNATIIFLPFGLWMLNRVPQVLTLQPEKTLLVGQARGDGGMEWRERSVGQPPFLIRAVWFFLVGWWLSFFWANLAWAIATTLIGLPIGIWMLNRLPAVTTLRQG
jgi:uncharacterized membrane protein YccF (DUF307 family)